MINRIDFQVIFSVDHANPNGDPIDGNRPRQLNDGRGEVTDVCLKRKIRNRLDDLGAKILIKSMEDCVDDDLGTTVLERYQAGVNNGNKLNGLDGDVIAAGLREFIDIRLFGQVYAFVDKSNGEHTRGAVSITNAMSIDPIEIHEVQITKSISNTEKEKRGSDTMGMKYNVPFGLYTFFGSVSGRIAEKNGVTDDDIDKLKQALCTLFKNDESTARPYGSMNVEKVIWYEHDSIDGQVRPDEIKNALVFEKLEGVDIPSGLGDYRIGLRKIDGIKPEIYNKPR